MHKALIQWGGAVASLLALLATTPAGAEQSSDI
jgi:hypothetical protein